VSNYPGALQFGGAGQSPLFCNCRTRIKTHYNNWGPRVGFAYRLGDKTVLRAGYGMMYTRHGAVGGRGGARDGTGKLGYSASPGFSSADGYSPAFDWDDGVPAYQKPPFVDPTLNTGFYTGRPTGGSVNFDNPQDGARPPRYQNWNFSVQRALTPSTTLTPSAGAYGLYGAGFWNEDVGLTRQFRITERFKLDFSAEAFNVFNAVIFSGPASLDINDANFGRITSQQNSPRSMQLAMKLNF